MSWRSGSAVAAAVVAGGLMLGSAANATPIGPTLAGEVHSKSAVTDVAIGLRPIRMPLAAGLGVWSTALLAASVLAPPLLGSAVLVASHAMGSAAGLPLVALTEILLAPRLLLDPRALLSPYQRWLTPTSGLAGAGSLRKR